jgi:hypothetical protein
VDFEVNNETRALTEREEAELTGHRMSYVFRSEASPRPQSPVGVCRHCGGPVEAMQAARWYCSPRHKKRANRRRKRGLPGSPRPGECYCGKTFEPFVERPRSFCSRSCREAYRLAHADSPRPWEQFRRAVKWPHDLTWLAPKLGIAEDDPRLPQFAVKLALAGKLAVYIRADGTVGEVGRLRPKP